MKQCSFPIALLSFLAGCNTAPKQAALAPSGPAEYTIGYASFSPLNAEIFLADRDGTNAVPFLPGPSNDINPSFANDGNWVVFTSDRNGNFDIYRAHPDGSGLEQLTDDPAFDDQAVASPDGSKLAFVSTRTGRAQIFVMDLASHQATNITHHENGGHFRPAWSPDGKWIAFSSDRDVKLPTRPNSFETIQQTDLYVARPDGSDLNRLTFTNAYAGSPRWSPDGKKIAYYTTTLNDLVAISDPRRLRGTTQISLVELSPAPEKGPLTAQGGYDITQGAGEKWSPAWVSLNGMTLLAYASGGPGGGIEYVAADPQGIPGAPSGSTPIAPGPRGEFNTPVWSADGKRMVYYRDMGQNWPPVAISDSRDPKFGLLRTGIFPSFAPTGDRLVFTTGTAALTHNGMIEANVDGSNRWLIHDDLEHNTVAPAWSPRGDVIAFGSGGAFQGAVGVAGRVISNIAVIQPDGTGFRLLTNENTNHNFPAWSPDGSKIVFRTQDEKGKGLRILNVADGTITHLTEGDFYDNFPSWSPNGQEIVFTSNREESDFEIYAIHPDGTGLRRITHIPGNDAHATWSPDGQWLAFATGIGVFKDEMALHPHNPQSYGEIAVMRPDGSALHILTDNPWEDSTPRWAPMPLTALP